METQSDFTADTGALLDHLAEYERVRGWRARRVYLTTREKYTLLVDPAARGTYLSTGPFVFDGAEIRQVWSIDVAARIREWDLKGD